MELEDAADIADFSRRFRVELFIVHPTIDPAVITTTLAMESKYFWRVGDPRVTPKGTVLTGNRVDTRWRFSAEYTISDQWFADKVDDLIHRLESHKSFLLELHATGGQSTLIVQFLGDGYFGDKISIATLAKFVDLGLSLSIECFADKQN
jgi:hypothetical protein